MQCFELAQDRESTRQSKKSQRVYSSIYVGRSSHCTDFEQNLLGCNLRDVNRYDILVAKHAFYKCMRSSYQIHRCCQFQTLKVISDGCPWSPMLVLDFQCLLLRSYKQTNYRQCCDLETEVLGLEITTSILSRSCS